MSLNLLMATILKWVSEARYAHAPRRLCPNVSILDTLAISFFVFSDILQIETTT
jgi:hypothetical protein